VNERRLMKIEKKELVLGSWQLLNIEKKKV